MNLYEKLCRYQNLELAFKKARKGKTKKAYVKVFEEKLEQNILRLQEELFEHTYRPKPLDTFILKDPKTRRISRSDFRDRVVHHALCNIIEPLFDKTFIFDSYANRKGKGTLKAIERFEHFSRKVSANDSRACFVLKADVRKYFDSVSHDKLMSILAKKIGDERVLWLCRVILDNFSIAPGRGMPLGNLTSQFFANVYLNELDQFVKHELKAKYYVRYVDDFAILDTSFRVLEQIKLRINEFLRLKLDLELHPQKSCIRGARRGVDFLGMRVFPTHRLLRKKNVRKFKKKWTLLDNAYQRGLLPIEKMHDSLQGWCAYAKHACAYKQRLAYTKTFDEGRRELSEQELRKYIVWGESELINY